MTKEFIHVSVAWPYANGDLHVGHLTGANLPADIFARYHRLKGNHVLMVSGSDSHGTPIMVEAAKRDMNPLAFFEIYHNRFLKTLKKVGISYDLYTHTHTENHMRVAQDIFKLLLERGYLIKQPQTLLYSELEGRFLPDRFVEGECYVCHNPKARGDQCDKCGTLIDAIKLINPRSRNNPDDHLTPRDTEHYFLDLPQFKGKIEAYLDEHEGHWRIAVMNFSRNFLKDLHARPITRDIDWGVPVPLEGWEDKRLYVWFDAVMGYLTASIEWANNIGKPDEWKKWWYNPEAKIYNFLGKDNIPFHTVIWQAELLGADGIYNPGDTTAINLPYDVPANEFMNIEGEKFSKSNNWAVWLPDFLDAYQADAVRYYALRNMPETQDSDFSWDGFYQCVNNELLAAWGNLVNRVLGFGYKRYEGKVPTFDKLTPADEDIIAHVNTGFEKVGALYEAVKLREALSTAMGLVRDVNVYLDGRAPWKTVKTDEEDAKRSVFTALYVIQNLNTLLAPILPFSAQKVHELLGNTGQLFGTQEIVTYQEASSTHTALIYHGEQAIGKWETQALKAGQALPEPSALYTKLDEEIVEVERAKLGKPREEREIEA
jgi:methionyl-tRNA synthetase